MVRCVSGSPPDPSTTTAARRRERALALTVRAVLACAVVLAAVPDLSASEVRHVGYGLAFGWLPMTYVADGLRHRWSTAPVRAMAAVAEVAGPGYMVLRYDALATSTLTLAGVVVAAHLIVGDRRFGAHVGVLAGVGAVVGAVVEPPIVESSAAAAFVGVLVALGVVSASALEDRARTSRGLIQVRQRSDAILSGVGEAVVVTSPRGRIRQWNDAAAVTFACSPADAVGEHCSEVLGLRRDVSSLDCASGCPLVGQADQEVWRLLVNGERQPLLAVALAIEDSEGRVSEVVHSLRDITSLKQADEAKTMFLATASHELKTPLTVIQGFSGVLLAADDLPERHRPGIDAINRRSRDLGGIVDRLLMTSRIEAGRVELNLRATDVVPVVTECVAAIGSARQRDIDVQVDAPIADAHADPDAVRTIVEHLVDNAITYTPGGGAIQVSVQQRDGRVEILVEDNGIGMTPAQAEQCFDRFWQAEATEVRRYGGTGIGLYIVRSLTEAMHGAVTVTTELGKGSVFRISLWTSEAFAERGEAAEPDAPTDARPEPSIIREFMRQVGIQDGGRR